MHVALDEYYLDNIHLCGEFFNYNLIRLYRVTAMAQQKRIDQEKVSSLFQELPVPLLRPSKFAEYTGINDGTVTTMMDKAQLPVVRLTPAAPGRRPSRYINMVALFELCQVEGEQWLSTLGVSGDF